MEKATNSKVKFYALRAQEGWYQLEVEVEKNLGGVKKGECISKNSAYLANFMASGICLRIFFFFLKRFILFFFMCMCARACGSQKGA